MSAYTRHQTQHLRFYPKATDCQTDFGRPARPKWKVEPNGIEPSTPGLQSRLRNRNFLRDHRHLTVEIGFSTVLSIRYFAKG